MSEPLVNAYGQWLCPLVRQEEEYENETDASRFTLRPCLEPLHLVVTETHDLAPIEPNGAITRQWEIQCEGGHHLLSSEREEYAEPFDPELALKALFPTREREA